MTASEGQPTRAHLFCRVIDNHGDLGVCWRLARQLQTEQGLDVTLLVDDLAAFALLAPGLDTTQAVQGLDGLTVMHWRDDLVLSPAELVIEGFACELPAGYIDAMASQSRQPTWINLEYLSAEPWVEDCHRLPSTHARTGLAKHFWFPGFTPRTGGLLREQALIRQLSALDPQAVRGRHGIAPNDRLLTLFCYPDAPLGPLLATLADDRQPTTLVSFAGKSLFALSSALGVTLMAGQRHHQGALTVLALPLLPHADYDELLACADLNLVRGEDSFVRAQWAGRAMLWHIYAQDDTAHLTKLAAWQQRVRDAITATGATLPACWDQVLTGWNNATALDVTGWRQLLASLPELTAAMRHWRTLLLSQQDLSTQLMRFHTDQVESAPDPKHPRNR